MNYDKQPIINHMEYFEETILEEGQTEISPSHWTDLPLDSINRCFSGETVEEIFNRLENEGSVWATDILEKLKKKSSMSLKLTLKLLREGLKSQWGECLKREFRFATRRLVINLPF